MLVFGAMVFIAAGKKEVWIWKTMLFKAANTATNCFTFQRTERAQLSEADTGNKVNEDICCNISKARKAKSQTNKALSL